MSEWPYDEPSTAQLQAEAEVDRLRDKLADARRERDQAHIDLVELLAAAYALIEEYDPDRAAQAREALSAGGTDQDEGGER